MDSKNKILWLSNLSKIGFSDTELSEMEKDMSSIIALMDSLKEVILPSEESLITGVNMNNLREDTICSSLDILPLISQSERQERNCFSIPKVVE